MQPLKVEIRKFENPVSGYKVRYVDLSLLTPSGWKGFANLTVPDDVKTFDISNWAMQEVNKTGWAFDTAISVNHIK